MARVGGSMLLAGGVLTAMLTVVNPGYSNGRPAVVTAVSAGGVAFGLVCVLLPDRMPGALLNALPAVGTLLICTSMLLSRTPQNSSVMLLIWPVLFAGYFLAPAVAWCSFAMVVGLYTPIALWVLGPAGLTPATNVAGTSLITLLIMAALRRRITDLLAAVEAEARTDGLTGLPNRRALDEVMVTEVGRAVRHGQPLSVVIADLDRFKRLNDTAGHAAGDEALRRVARLMQGHVRRSDVVARLGGEEFVLVLPATDEREALALAERLRTLVRAESRSWPYEVTVSAGVATFPDHAGDTAELFAAADEALYAAKGAGRDAVRASTRTPAEVPALPAVEAD